MIKKVLSRLGALLSKIAVLAWFGYVVATVCFVAKWIVEFLYGEE